MLSWFERCRATIRFSSDPLVVCRQALRAKLRQAYDAFVAKYSAINKEERTITSWLNRAGEPIVITRYLNFSRFMDDPDAWKVASIENMIRRPARRLAPTCRRRM